MELSRRFMLTGMTAAATSAAVAGSAMAVTSSKDLRTAVKKALAGGGRLTLPAGEFSASGIVIDGALLIEGVPGRTRIKSADGKPVFLLNGPEPIVLRGVTVEGDGKGSDVALISADGATNLVIEDCFISNTAGSGIRLEGCAGRFTGNRLTRIGGTAVFARDSKGLEISGNIIRDIGNNGIQVWTSERTDGEAIVCQNRIERVRADAGGTGQNGNGINVYRAGNVIVSENRITDCQFSAVRNNAGDNCHILNNSISRMGEVAIYCEFGFEGAVVSGNIIDDVALGISITNFNEGGRLATVANNVVRRAKGGGTLPQTSGVGIGAEGDVAVIGNVVEDSRDTGISLGWGPYSRTLSATGNIVRHAAKGIVFSMSEGADGVLIANNRISGAQQAILGSDHGTPVTADLGKPGAEIPDGVVISANLVS
jgi:uncharacterized secreted repeat protein (TIGR03808 family)